MSSAMSSAAVTVTAANHTTLTGFRYRLPDIVLLGRPISTNRYRVKTITKSGYPIDFHSKPALDWMEQAKNAAIAALALRGDGIPHPREWPRPLRVSVYVRDNGIDLDNCLKVPLDGIRRGLGVDDKLYEYGEIVREAYKTGQRGLRFVIESAPLPPSGSVPPSRPPQPPETTKPAKRRGSCRAVSPQSSSQRLRDAAAHQSTKPVQKSRAKGPAMS